MKKLSGRRKTQYFMRWFCLLAAAAGVAPAQPALSPCPPERVLEIDTEGLTSPVLERLQFSHLPRPSYPLDEATEWTPPDW